MTWHAIAKACHGIGHIGIAKAWNVIRHRGIFLDHRGIAIAYPCIVCKGHGNVMGIGALRRLVALPSQHAIIVIQRFSDTCRGVYHVAGMIDFKGVCSTSIYMIIIGPGIGMGYSGITGPRGIVVGQYGNAMEPHQPSSSSIKSYMTCAGSVMASYGGPWLSDELFEH